MGEQDQAGMAGEGQSSSRLPGVVFRARLQGYLSDVPNIDAFVLKASISY